MKQPKGIKIVDKRINTTKDHRRLATSPHFVERFTDLLDTRFRIPGTNMRFGVDFIIGLIPYGGDLLSFVFSGGLILAIVHRGVSGEVALKMLGNVFLDTVVGSLPFLGDLFDLTYKANRRNLLLLQEYQYEGKHTGSGKGLLLAVLLVLIAMFVLLIFALVKIGQLIAGLF